MEKVEGYQIRFCGHDRAVVKGRLQVESEVLLGMDGWMDGDDMVLSRLVNLQWSASFVRSFVVNPIEDKIPPLSEPLQAQ